MRYLFLLPIMVLSSIGSAQAGFEFIAPKESGVRVGEEIKRQTRDEALTPGWQENLSPKTSGVSAVESVPLSNDGPTSLFPPSQQEMMAERQTMQQAQRRPSSDGKLFIDPYPLRSGSMVAPIQGKETYKAMQEKSKKLHPVNLGSGYSTGAKPKAIPFPQPIREASMARKTFSDPVPSVNMGTNITPMQGGEIAALPSVNNRANPSSSNKQYAQAIGFGQDLPLALALSQVIPNDFTHSFAKDVDAGVNVSWEGGKAWNMVLNDMLRPHKLTAVIQGNQVTIQSMASL